LSSDLPASGAIAATIDLSARLRAFDSDGSLQQAAREAWAVIEPDAPRPACRTGSRTTRRA
jgi:methyl-accepting chemotaxis protein